MKRRIKNSQTFSNVKSVADDGLIELKTGEVASLIEVKAIDLSLTSKSEKNNFFYVLKSLYQIRNLNLKCYKLDQKINLNNNKINLEELINYYKDDSQKEKLLDESKRLIEELEENHFTISSVYYLVVIAKDLNTLEKQLDEIEEIISNITPRINMEVIDNRLEIYKFLTNLYMNPKALDDLMWSDLPSLVSPLSIQEKTNMLKMDDKDIQMVTIKNIPPFVDELFFEEIFNVPDVRACISIKDAISQDELVRWVNSQYQFLLSDRSTTKKLSDATELDTQKENFQQLMVEIKNGDEKIKEVSLTLIITGTKKERENTFRDLKRLVDRYQIKLDIPKLRQMECWQNYDLTTTSLDDYSIYLPTLTLSAGFPFTKTYFNDSSGYMLGVDLHTSLPIFFDPFIINNQRTSHNIAIVSSTGGGKSFTMKKMIINEYARGTKIFILDAENEYKNLVISNGGEYIDLYSKKGGIINPLQIRYIPSDDEDKETKETDCPLAKHLGFLEAFFKTAFEDITEKELVMLLSVVESLYNTKGIFKNTSINTLQSLSPSDYPIFRDTVIYKKLSCYSSGELKRKITPLEDLSYTYFTVENIQTKYDRLYRNRNNKEINKEELSFYDKFKTEEINKLNNIVNVVNDLLKDKIKLFEFKENNNRTFASFELKEPLNTKESIFLKGKINKEVYHLEIDNGNNTKSTIEIHLKNPLEKDLALERNNKNNV